MNWALARQNAWEIVLRIEDLDGPRIKQGATQQAIELLEWLGMDWDIGPVYQAHYLAPYQNALQVLAERGEVFACNCTRGEIEAASRSAPHGNEHDLRYPGTCRPAHTVPIARSQVDLENSGWRMRVPAGPRTFVDQVVGPQSMDISRTVGDFQVWTKGGLPSYQLAVVVDDARQGIDRIVRGNDLLSSTPRQSLIADRLGLSFRPEYWHLPLVRGEDGRRLAKRHGDTRLLHLRKGGVSAERVIGLLAEWCGMGSREPMSASEFLQAFRIEQLSGEDIVYRTADDEWLLQG